MDKALLFKPRLPEDTHEIPGVGTVRVRGLSRAEVITVKRTEDDAAGERFALSRAMVDPTVTEDEAGEWQRAATHGEIDALTDKIAELSGMGPNTARKVVEEFEADPSAEFRNVPGSESGNDGRAPA